MDGGNGLTYVTIDQLCSVGVDEKVPIGIGRVAELSLEHVIDSIDVEIRLRRCVTNAQKAKCKKPLGEIIGES